MFLLIPSHPGSSGQTAIKRLLSLLLVYMNKVSKQLFDSDDVVAALSDTLTWPAVALAESTKMPTMDRHNLTCPRPPTYATLAII